MTVLKKYRLLLVDLDGVLWRGTEVLEDNVSALKEFEKRGYRIVYMSNNSSKSRREYARRIRNLGLNASRDNVYNSGYLTALYIVERGIGDTFVIGENGLIEELILQNIPVIVDRDYADYVVVGLDRYLTYDKLSKALQYLLKGAYFIATNTDHVYPVGDHLEPGAGVIVSALSTALKREPDFIAGKPNTWIVDVVLRKYGVSRDEVLIIGDGLETDIALGSRAGVDTLLVLTGITDSRCLEKSSYKPTYVSKNLLEVVDDIL